jgi:hypothetical protein
MGVPSFAARLPPAVHRQRTKLVARTTRISQRLGRGERLVHRARALELKGIVATYTVHDRVLANRRARRHFEHAPPVLDETQGRVLADLEQRDYAVLPLADLCDEDTVAAVLAEGEPFAARAAKAESHDPTKDYLVRRYERGQEIAPDSPWLACVLSDRLVDLANAYLRMWSKLEYVDFWYSVPVDDDARRVQSQRWHRDWDDLNLLKAFLYLVDVDEHTGPMEFIAGSARGGILGDLYPPLPRGAAYPDSDEFDRAVRPEDVKTFTAPAGTLVLCNTSGFHRGGFATAKPRVLATATYCSPASLKSLTERNYRLPSGYVRSLGEPQRFVVT